MTVKVGDIVRYKGIEQRLMMCGTYIFRVSHNGSIGGSPSSLELGEPVILPNLEVGDWVIVDDIPAEEKKAYLTTWYDGYEEIVTSGKPHPIDEIHDTIVYGTTVKINNYWFLPYHLTKTDGYDII